MTDPMSLPVLAGYVHWIGTFAGRYSIISEKPINNFASTKGQPTDITFFASVPVDYVRD
jgi:hypothetical protein